MSRFNRYHSSGDLDDLIYGGAYGGLDALSHFGYNPFAHDSESAWGHIDKKELKKLGKKLYKEGLKIYDGDKKTAALYARSRLASLVSSGDAFDEEGEEILLKGEHDKKKSGLERIASWFRGTDFEGKYGLKKLEKKRKLFDDLVGNIYRFGRSSLNAAPKLYHALSEAARLNVAAPAIETMRKYGVITAKKADELLKKAHSMYDEYLKFLKEGVEEAFTAPKNYQAQEVVAGVLSGIGLLIMFLYTLGMTGNFIAETGSILINSGFFSFGVLLWLGSMAWFYITRRKHKKLKDLEKFPLANKIKKFENKNKTKKKRLAIMDED